ncbi:IucA/IucC family protein [Pseudomonas syringae]|uniref:IucA/IucC family protein n=1 Tax=Pseudomonas syringae TaxID=317 RepID=UPI001F39D0F3|nr:IucA/IucC family protein [Pseudomonas syringae]MCF5736576.1 IucA/IucC family siderophore biosynthesis protein [Pseudomonas syringae]MCF5740234.1 IucA/IucC family siderophore biosynthesis protein [Pseudomonas syringae]MCF5749529.1 IucA/IucC family siderophore biosynthesis protein [Pseudomonas syringae]MCF5756103.1 IucA/IucC family siderophore biosynthesis protein [Pseudomonas syringae]
MATPLPLQRNAASTTTTTGTGAWLADISAERYQQVQRRVIGQLLQTLLYEAALPYRCEPLDDHRHRFVVAVSGGVEYRCDGLLSNSFELIRLDHATLERVDSAGERSVPDLHLALTELLSPFKDSPHLTRFIQEIEQTQLKDLQARNQGYQPARPAHQLDVDALEQHFMDAHSYHPCYKSRIGFSLADNRHYGPEFATPFAVVWLAVAKSSASVGHSRSMDFQAFIRQELGIQRWHEITRELAEQGKSIDDYQLMPVHPWQWDNVTVSTFYPELASGELIYLGTSTDSYKAQQSIRTLANASQPQRPYVKLAMSMTNTSSTRILARHTVLNGPIITDWLHQLIATDSTAQALDFVILGEVAGVSFDYRHLPESRSAQTYGTLGAIWRESLHQYLRDDEQAVPFNGLSHVENRYGDGQQTPFIDAWVSQYGLNEWTRQLLQVTVPPIIHMLYAEGIGMESHGQNIVLIVKQGWPQRIALKDFHDGVRYSPAHLGRPELCPELVPLPASHAKLNRNSFIITDDVNAVRDFSCDCFFFICLAEMAIFLRQQYQLDEALFWQMTADVILDYQRAHPQHRDRFGLFDVFAPSYEVEELTKRRLLGDGERRFRSVPNPLHTYRPQ